MQMAKDLGVDCSTIIGNKDLIDKIDKRKYTSEKVGAETIDDIIAELLKPGRDPRCEVEAPIFNSEIKSIEDLSVGMILDGIVNNITAFGAFVDIGIKESGLIHISQLSDKRVNSVSDVLSLNRKVTVRVIDVDLARHRVSLSMKGLK
jgi:uncharacterized protein